MKFALTPVVALLAAAAAFAGDATITVSDPTNVLAAPVTVTIDDGHGANSIPVVIPPGAPAAAKRDLIVAALRAEGYDALADGNNTSLTIHGLPGNTTVTFDPGQTGEPADAVTRPKADSATTNFIGFFEPFDSNRQPAIFTAGIVTDVGELTAQVSASELNFQTDGPIICQALFQRLAPRAPHYGAEINFAGDRLEVYFDPAYTVTQGGIIFGTTSPSQGCAGQTHVPIDPTLPDLIMRVGSVTQQDTIPIELIRLSLVSIDPITVTFDGPLPPDQARDQVVSSLRGRNLWALPDPMPDTLIVPDIDPLNVVTIETGNTGQAQSMIRMPERRSGHVAFENIFEPFDAVGQPAIFTAGIVTDVGELSVQVSAQELNFQTDGPIICQALFQRLAPRAPQYGAQINYAGDRLEVYFDPAYTVTQGGIIFGTSSLSQGASGQISPDPICPADLNDDGNLNVFDFLLFQNLYSEDNPAADFAPPFGVLNVFDFLEYMNWFAAGCEH